MNVAGKVALITGGGHRVGRAITLMLARLGANVAVNYNTSQAAAVETVEQAQEHGVEAVVLQADVAKWSEVDNMAAQIEARFGGVDVIVNSASLFAKTPFPTSDLETWRRVLAISIDGPFYVCNRLAPGMAARGGGAIVNIVDLSAWYPWPNFMAHSVGKAGLLAMTRQLALELAPTIRVNAVAPGPVLPPPDYDARQQGAVAERTLLKRWGTPEDVARAVRYFVEADYVTGDVMTVDGGERFGPRKLP